MVLLFNVNKPVKIFIALEVIPVFLNIYYAINFNEEVGFLSEIVASNILFYISQCHDETLISTNKQWKINFKKHIQSHICL